MWVVMRLTKNIEIDGSIYGIPLKMEFDVSRDFKEEEGLVGFLSVYSTRELAEAAYPGAVITEIKAASENLRHGAPSCDTLKDVGGREQVASTIMGEEGANTSNLPSLINSIKQTKRKVKEKKKYVKRRENEAKDVGSEGRE